jgi:hypothetical protein
MKQATMALQLTDSEQSGLEDRLQTYGGKKNRWLGRSGTFLSRTGQMKAVDWKRFVCSPLEYFMHDLYDEPYAGTLQAVLSVLAKLLFTTCNKDNDCPNADRIVDGMHIYAGDYGLFQTLTLTG